MLVCAIKVLKELKTGWTLLSITEGTENQTAFCCVKILHMMRYQSTERTENRVVSFV